MIDPAVIDAMLGAGCTAEQIAAVVKADLQAQAGKVAEKREAERIRKQKQRAAAKAASAMSRGQRGTPGDTADTISRAHVEDKTSNSEIEPQKTNTHAKDLGEFRSALSGVCDEARIDEFVKHRRKKRGTLTGHAARLFLSDAESCGLSVPEAIDTCISRNWITVKPEFLASRARAGPAPAKTPSMAQIFGMVKDKAAADGQERTDSSGFREAVRDLPVLRRAQ